MKPCPANQQRIVWLTLNALDARQTRQLRAHLETCAGCRHYLAEISNVANNLSAAAAPPEVQATEHFHQNLARKLRATPPESFGEILTAYLRLLHWNWRVTVPTAASLLLASALLATWPHPALIISQPSPRPQAAADSSADLTPTMANYERAADQSLEKLDALLTRQNRRTLPTQPTYTTSTLDLANESF